MNATDSRARLASLRTLIAEKFPSRDARRGRRRPTGCPAVDEESGGLLEGVVTEVSGSSSGAQILLSAILETAVREGFHVGLIDGSNAFHPSDWPDSQLRRLLWIACDDAMTAVKAADLLVRDGNLPVLILDLQGSATLHKIPASTWHRFHRLMEQSACALAVFTSTPTVEGAFSRLAVDAAGGLGARLEERSRLARHLRVRVFERGAFALPAPQRQVA